ncbi:MAG TPA: hypothetical protein VKJ47_14610 [Candidatus Binatia bacterium]|nr:hypothetical protein [Candidatus Binatia bacterium]
MATLTGVACRFPRFMCSLEVFCDFEEMVTPWNMDSTLGHIPLAEEQGRYLEVVRDFLDRYAA